MSIAYNEIGNPLTYGDDISYLWDGRELIRHQDEESEITVHIGYNADGLRTLKTVIDFSSLPWTMDYYSYTWSADGTLLGYSVKTYTNESIADVWIIYGENGDAIGFTVTDYEGVEPTTYTYYYIKNAQGDVLRVVDETGATMADYTYDAWGNFTYTADPNAGANADIIERYNPVTYRGYYYDNDLEMYYLQSRYYNPQWGRFLNPDICADTGESIVGTNMFAYCSNNPVMLIDPSGELAAFGFENNSDNWYGWFTTPWSTKKNAWQKKFGYCDLYDYTAPALKIYIDCLISEFEFGTLKWRVQLWKGKYGPSVGAEIGFYHQSKDRRFFRSFYICSDDIWFQMSFTLYWSDDNYDLHEIFSVEAGEQGHWWLTGFLANSVYSILPGTPQNLVMLAVIDFKNAEMANGFKDNLGKRVGTGYFDALVVGNQAIITWAPENHEYTIT